MKFGHTLSLLGESPLFAPSNHSKHLLIQTFLSLCTYTAEGCYSIIHRSVRLLTGLPYITELGVRRGSLYTLFLKYSNVAPLFLSRPLRSFCSAFVFAWPNKMNLPQTTFFKAVLISICLLLAPAILLIYSI